MIRFFASALFAIFAATSCLVQVVQAVPQTAKTIPKPITESNPETNAKPNPEVLAAIESAFEYLISKQSPKDGGWHSECYGPLRQGAASSGLVIYSLSHLPDPLLQKRKQEITRAAEFVRRRILKNGSVANHDGSLDYPVYCTAMLLTAHLKMDLGILEADTQRMLNYLLMSQCLQRRGFENGNVNIGGWDILGLNGPVHGKTPGANVSVTFYVTEALKGYSKQDRRVEDSLKNANQWCLSLQNAEEGGFYFSAIRKSPLNKAGTTYTGTPRSYGSATQDGIGILLNTGMESKNFRLQNSIEWMNKNPQLTVPGFENGHKESAWAKALQYYYLAAYSRNISMSRDAASRKNKIIKLLLRAQEKDGSWKNALPNMREDDPLIATSFALIALCNLTEAKTK